MPPPGATSVTENAAPAAALREAAMLLEAQGANPFRVGAYRTAAFTIERAAEPVRELYRRGGVRALEDLPGVGPGIAAALAELLRTGHWSMLARLRGGQDPELALRAVPGVGPKRAALLHEHLHVDSLEGLAASAIAGRLRDVPGLGARRAAAIEAAVIQMVERPRGTPRRPAAAAATPAVGLLLDVDREYRQRAAQGTLPRISPRRLNPEHAAWLPVLHTTRGPWHFTALYSNTARAHRLGRTGDWVVIYDYDSAHQEAVHTVVTETHGPLKGQRVVRGREAECAAVTSPAAAAPS